MNVNINYHPEQNRPAKPGHLDSRKGHRISAAVSAFVVFLLFCFFRRLAPFVYQTNDDLFLRMIVSGEISGTPESHLHFISYPAGLFLSFFYRLFPKLPWYGLFLCFSFGLAMILILIFLLRQEKTLSARSITIFLFCMLSYGFLFPHIAELQFTTSAGIAASGALFLFTVSSPSSSFRETLKNNAGFLLLSAYAFCIRYQVLFMCFPFLGMIGLSRYLDAGKLPEGFVSNKESSFRFIHKNNQQKNLLLLGGIFFTMVLSFFLIEKFAYHSDEWRSFRSYSAARASIYDYEGYPDYDAHEETYRELGLSRSSYEGAAHRYCLILEPAINQHSMEVLENISKQEQSVSFADFPGKLCEMAAFFIERHRSDADRPLNLLVYRCYLLFIICTIFSRKWNALRDILFTLFARMVIWSYLVFYGRLPVRISQTVYLAELAVLFAVAFRHKVWLLRGNSSKRQKLCYAAWAISLLIILFTCIRSGIPNAKAAAENSSARLQFSESFSCMKDYFKAHSENIYYLDTNSFAYFTEDALQADTYKDSNYIFMGGWAAKSPWYEKKWEKTGIEDPAAALFEEPCVYAVFMNTEETNYDYLEAFYAENYPGVYLETTETIDAGNGISFLILKARQEKTP